MFVFKVVLCALFLPFYFASLAPLDATKKKTGGDEIFFFFVLWVKMNKKRAFCVSLLCVKNVVWRPKKPLFVAPTRQKSE